MIDQTPDWAQDQPADNVPDWAKDPMPMPMSEVASQAAENAPSSLYNVGAQLAHAVAHPIETVQNLAGLGAGMAQKQQSMYAEALGKPMAEGQHEKNATAMAGYLSDRYGGIENVKRSFAKDPVGVLADLSLPLTGMGGAASRLPGIAGRVGEIAANTGRFMDPVNAVGEGARYLSTPIKKLAAVQSGVGEPVLEQAYGAGLEGGAKQQAFQSHFAGTAPLSDIVDQAHAGLDAMGRERSTTYNREMDMMRAQDSLLDERDQILDFNKIHQAIDSAEGVATYRGRFGTGPRQVLDPGANEVRSAMIDHIHDWEELNPIEYHSVEGMDALKKQLYNDMRGTQAGTPARLAAGRIYNAVKGTIEAQYPRYTEIMSQYQDASHEMDEVRRALSLGDKATVDTSLRKLQSLLRNNVTSSFAHRAQLGERIEDAGAPNLRASLAGQALNTSEPRGLAKHAMQNIIPAMAGALGYGTHGGIGAGLAMGATLPFMFPKVVGSGAFRAGQVRRLLGPTLQRSRDIPIGVRNVGEMDQAMSPQKRGGRIDSLIGPTIGRVHKQGGGELSPDDQAAMMPETFNPIPDWTRQAAQKDVGTLRNIGSGIGNAATSLATLPKRAIEASQQDVQHLGEEGYEPKLTGPALEAASLPMGTGAIAGLRMAPREVALGAGPIRRTYASPEYNPDELHPASISTRLPTGAKATEDPVAQSLTVDTPAMKATPGGLYDTNVDLVRDYPGMKKGLMTGSTDRAAKQFQDQVTDNLLWLHDQVPPEIRERSKLWYDGANKIVKDTAGQYGIPDQSAAGVYAALSPQKDWFQNVSLGKRLIDTYFNKAQAPWSPQMSETVNRIFGEPKYDDMRNAILDTKLSEHEDPIAKAMWIRTYDQAHNSPAHPIVTPEGGFGDVVSTKSGAPARVAWGSLPEIAKGVGSIESGGDPAVLGRLMGEKHKVRSFYNNMLDPMSKRGDVTIDTHAVAAGLLRPLSGNSLEVAHNFANYPGKGMPSASGSAISGIQGTYPLYADAYRQAAAERGILPREMQSITWEAVRGLFPDTFKTAKNNEAIDNIWKQYGRGRLNLDQARSKIYDLAGGIRNPDWYGR